MIKDILEIQFWRVAKRIILKGYGADCETSDLDDFPEKYQTPQSVFNRGRCGSCRAKEMVNWIDDHISLIQMMK